MGTSRSGVIVSRIFKGCFVLCFSQDLARLVRPFTHMVPAWVPKNNGKVTCYKSSDHCIAPSIQQFGSHYILADHIESQIFDRFLVVQHQTYSYLFDGEHAVVAN